MLSVKENDRLTRVGPGTPMGALLRRYWYPVAASAALAEEPVKPIKILGESLVLFRDRQGRLGLIGDTCPHRRISLLYAVHGELVRPGAYRVAARALLQLCDGA